MPSGSTLGRRGQEAKGAERPQGEEPTLSSSATYSNTSNFEPSPSIRAALNAALHPHVFTACA